MDIEFYNHFNRAEIEEMGMWLEESIPNPPLPEPQRWTIGYSIDGREGIHFQNEYDAFLFKVAFGSK